MSDISIALLISLLGLDTTIAFQVLISQPIFSCTIIGWLMGDVVLGMEIGAIMQLLWLNLLPVGAAAFPEGNIASMLVAVIVIRFAELGIPNLVFTAAFILGFVSSYAGLLMTNLDRRVNVRILEWAEHAAHSADVRKLTLLDIFSILVYLMLMAVLAYLLLTISDVLFPLLQQLPLAWEAKLQYVKPVVFGIGVALTAMLLIHKINIKK